MADLTEQFKRADKTLKSLGYTVSRNSHSRRLWMDKSGKPHKLTADYIWYSKPARSPIVIFTESDTRGNVLALDCLSRAVKIDEWDKFFNEEK